MILENISTALGSNNTKYERKKFLEKFRTNYPSAEIIKKQTDHYVVEPDKSLSLEELAASEIITDAQRKVILDIIAGVGDLKTEYRNAITQEYKLHYEFVEFSNSRGKNRKLLLGNKRPIPIVKDDKRVLGNNSLKYSPEGAYLLYDALATIAEGKKELPEEKFYNDERGRKYVLLTRWNWYSLVYLKDSFLSGDIDTQMLSKRFINEDKWLGLIERYRNEKKQFYKSRLQSFLGRLSKVYPLEHTEKTVGIPLDEKDGEDEASYKDYQSGNIVVLSEFESTDISKQEEIYLKKYSIDRPEAYNGKTKAAKRFNYSMSEYIEEKYQLSRVWKVLAIRIDNEVLKVNPKELLVIEKDNDLSAMHSSVIECIENDWKNKLERRIISRRSNANNYALPWGYYNAIFDSLVFLYLDDIYDKRKFKEEDIKEFISNYFERANVFTALGDDVQWWLEVGGTLEDITSQLDEQDRELREFIYSYNTLTNMKEYYEKE